MSRSTTLKVSMNENEVVVPWKDLSTDALHGVIDEYVTREGTEYGAQDVPLEAKRAQVRRQLEAGEVVVLFDAKTSTTNIVTADQVR